MTENDKKAAIPELNQIMETELTGAVRYTRYSLMIFGCISSARAWSMKNTCLRIITSTEGKSVLLEEYAREMIMLEELHLDEVNKMLRNPP